MSNASATSALLDLRQASALIERGETLAIAGHIDCLTALPRGNWIGGTTPYFMAEEGGTCRLDRVFVQPFGQQVGEILCYDRQRLPHMLEDAPENGFSIVILPAASAVLEDYAREAPNYPDMYIKPIAGWVAGVHLDQLGSAQAQVIDGRSGRCYTDQAIVLHIPLPPDQAALVHAINLFSPGAGPTLRFDETGFAARECLIDGVRGSLLELIRARGIDTRLPLVADYCGAMINVSIQALELEPGLVSFYAPVFAGVDYRFADAVEDYSARFLQAMPRDGGPILFGCNCILNYLYSQLQGRQTARLTGPITFGEVAYQLLNQTAVYLTLEHS